MIRGRCTNPRCRVGWELTHPPASCPACGEPAPVESASAWYLGMDLGQAQDPCVLAAVERTVRVDQPGDVRTSLYRLRGLHSWPLKTAYNVVVGDLARFVAMVPAMHGARILVDCTRERAVYDMMRQAGLPLVLRPVLITGGHQTTMGDDGFWHIPKKELVSVLQKLLQGGRVEWDKGKGGLKLAGQLAKELTTFRVKITKAGNESFEAWQARDHDDLVCGLMLACWGGERYGGVQGTLPQPPKEERNPFEYLAPARQSAAVRRGLFGLTGRG